MDHRQRVQNQEALHSVTDGLRHPGLTLNHDHQDLQLVRPSPQLTYFLTYFTNMYIVHCTVVVVEAEGILNSRVGGFSAYIFFNSTGDSVWSVVNNI